MAQVREDFTALSEKQWAEAPIARIVTDNGVSDRLVFDRAVRGEQVTLTIPELKVKKTIVTDETGAAEIDLKAKPMLWSPENPKL